MSFAGAFREELQGIQPRRACCRRALACGLLIDAEARQGLVWLPCRDSAAVSYAAGVLQRQFGRAPRAQEEVARRHRSLWLELDSPAAARLLGRLDRPGAGNSEAQSAPRTPGAEEDGGLLPPDLLAPGCEGCRAAFLRGAFLSTGTLSDPHRSTHLEFLLRNPRRAELLAAFLTSCGYPPGVIRRGTGVGLYYKNGTAAEDLAALAGAGRTAMEMMNARIEREIRNQENRATNCVAKNIEKSVSASARQMAAIERLAVTGMLAQLPEPLRLTARLRAENPDASLEELRRLHSPPITKSGLNHRLQKLIEEAERH